MGKTFEIRVYHTSKYIVENSSIFTMKDNPSFYRSKTLNRLFKKKDTRTNNICMKMCLTSLAVSKMQIKATTKYHFTLTRRPNDGETVEQLECHIADKNVKWYKHFGKLLANAFFFFCTLNMHLPCDPGIPLI